MLSVYHFHIRKFGFNAMKIVTHRNECDSNWNGQREGKKIEHRYESGASWKFVSALEMADIQAITL